MATVELLDKAIALVDSLIAGSKPTAPAAGTATACAPTSSAVASAVPVATAGATSPAAPKPAKKPKEPKQAAPAAAASAPAPAASEDEALFNRVLIKVARIAVVEQLANSEKLYKLQIDLGAGETRQVCAGLRQYLTVEQLSGALVCVVANLKPAKLAGEASEAMVLAAEVAAGDSLLVRTLIPPAGAAPGDVVFLEGGGPSPAPDKVLKSDHWKKIGAGLRVAAGRATFNGRPLVTAAGPVTLPPEIVDGCEIH
ncbi:hypothetical protein VOLCADRAFT_106967 [Volvox carteri f. nagariensis]|uniref:tRNA-binding domain-containing protein n=1 Tax=Volvox carteri f. nagariensis TaxID=3068 RepID=D8UB01_VOLCA|nr:uncharacterized protein VOLCADRAFT_106967 [Volvox carteri f. nagariensis]EFJ43083.1 hypothetical protein VOLCADRAFT_106967 [Volvox carteri f. nagariensis]|eukprot:XP_002955882.1 hypothetical protein VOLCADRAFT_106967 [Volvox carteri f. nagariensis]